jgi:quinol-cytochrome oxidoreductase complex cytochrome b subunit
MFALFTWHSRFCFVHIILTIFFGVTGYSLLWDQIGYWVVNIVTSVLEAIPIIGAPLVDLLRGSVGVGQSTLTHFYSLHTFILPLLTAVFMLMHFPMIYKHGIKFNFKKQHFLVWFQIITISQDET